MDKKTVEHDIEEVGAGDSAAALSRRIDHGRAPGAISLGQTAGHGDKRASLDLSSASDASSREKQTSDISGVQEDATHTLNDPHTRPLWLQKTTSTVEQKLNYLRHMPVIRQVVNWINGPSPRRRFCITPFLPKLQSWPTKLLLPYFTQNSGTAFVTSLVCIIWLVIFSTVMATAKKTAIETAGTQAPIRLSCISTLWDDFCGLDSRPCQPLKGSSLAFTCPAGCASTKILNPYTVGGQEVNYQGLVIGGSLASNQSALIYRGDSFVCQAAIHAGVISDAYGGRATLNREGEQGDFESSMRNGMTSIGFKPNFPFSFSLSPSTENYEDPRWYVLVVSIFATFTISMIATPSALFFFSIFTITFFQVALASDPPWSSMYSGVVSLAFERFLPGIFVAVAIYHLCVRRLMHNMRAYWERTILWLGGLWVGAMNAYTFDRIPVSRLLGHDIRQQPGAIVALIVVVLVIFVLALGQIWTFQREGRLARYLKFYVLVGIILGCLSAIPSLDIRLHHYIIALLLLPGTSTQTRPSLLYQGILVGLFIQGIARWGFASVLQQTTQLLTGAQLGSAKPSVLAPSIFNGNDTGNSTIGFVINSIAAGFDGVSIRVNDVEHLQITNATVPVLFNWTRPVTDSVTDTYFRFAYTGTQTIGGIWYGDYTRPGTWLANGTWTGIAPGS